MGVENYILWVWKRVRIWRTRQHTPTKNSQEHLPGRICCPLVFIAQRTQKAKWCLVYSQMRKTRKSGRVKDWVCNICTHEDFDFDSSTVEPTLRMFQTMQLWGFFFIQYLCISQFQLHPAPPRGYCGAFARLVSPGGGAFANFVLPGGWAFANPEPFPTPETMGNLGTNLTRKVFWDRLGGRAKLQNGGRESQLFQKSCSMRRRHSRSEASSGKRWRVYCTTASTMAVV